MRGGGTEWGARSGKYDIMFSSSLHIFLSVFHSQTTIKTPCMQKMNDITGEDGDET